MHRLRRRRKRTGFIADGTDEEKAIKESVDNVSMDVLSMGMTIDYQTAIEEGSTCVRVGTGIFGTRTVADME